MSDAASVLELARSRPATLGAGRLVCIDGPAGSGKSTLSSALAALSGAQVVHTDDLCPGWDGLPQLPAILAGLLTPLRAGHTGRQPRYDWLLGRAGEDLVVPPADLVVLDGVGSGATVLAPLTTVLVWIDAPADVRKNRALARDGEAFAPHWDSWAAAETAFFVAEQVAERADVIIST